MNDLLLQKMKFYSLFNKKEVLSPSFSRTFHEKHIHLVNFTNCTKPFHILSAIGFKMSVPLHRQTEEQRAQS